MEWNGKNTLDTMIAFVSSQYGQTDVFTVGSNGENVQQITYTQNIDEYSPSWSPDNQWIIFVADDNGIQTLYRIKLDGSELIKIIEMDDVNSPSWRP